MFQRRRVFGVFAYIPRSKLVIDYVVAVAASIKPFLSSNAPLKVAFAIGDSTINSADAEERNSSLCYEKFIIDVLFPISVQTEDISSTTIKKSLTEQFGQTLTRLHTLMPQSLVEIVLPKTTAGSTPLTIQTSLYSNLSSTGSSLVSWSLIHKDSKIQEGEKPRKGDVIIHPIKSIRSQTFECEIYCEENLAKKRIRSSGTSTV